MPIDFTGIPTTGNRLYYSDKIERINEGLSDLPIDKRAAILGSIIEESGGDPLAKDASGKYQGLLQWGADRYVPQSTDEDTELNNQIQYIKSTIDNTKDGVSWTHGGNGSGYNSQKEVYNTFHRDKAPFNDRFRAFSYGYVRPAGKQDSYNNRLKVARNVLNKLVVNEVLSRPKKWVPQKFEKRQYNFPIKYGEGGSLGNGWDSLSYKEKAEMIKVAVENGITTLPEIREAYNKYAEGGPLKEWTLEDETKYRYWRSQLPKNLRDTNDDDYDMRAAFKAGMEPQWNEEDKNYHLGSRDPQSGRILKSPHHPTFLRALMEDASLGYYPTIDSSGHIYTNTWKGNNIHANGGYAPSKKLRQDIATWEGSEMKRNRPFSEMTSQFNAVVPQELQDRLSTNQLDALYSYGYNVGMGNLKERVLPTLSAYTQGKATKEDVQRSMWASRDNELRGLTRRRNWERELFGGNYRTEFTGKGKAKEKMIAPAKATPKINLGIQIAPEQYEIPDTFFDDFNRQISNVQMPQPVDFMTAYKPVVIDQSIFSKPAEKKEEFVYDPNEERVQGMRNLLAVMNMQNNGGDPFTSLAGGNGDMGLWEYFKRVYR